MSRIGRKPIPIPDKVEVDVKSGTVSVKGPNGTLEQEIPDGVLVAVKDGELRVGLEEGARHLRASQGL
ncbi:MAG: 50S ribosomal protein L6, partial [Deltaproteobacteria bacterium]|nr:50S ribosomal protein L6 [Deltaproteobacteria bacterium]